MRCTFRTLSALALVLFLPLFAAPVRAGAQDSTQNQAPRPITSLPLPPDEIENAPAAQKPQGTAPALTAPAVTPGSPRGSKIKPGRRGKKGTAQPSAAAAPATTTAPAITTPAAPSLVVITPETPAPAATTPSASPAPATGHGKRGRKTPVAPAAAATSTPAADQGVHAITGLPLPPDEEPAPAPTPATKPALAPAPKPSIAPAPKKPVPAEKKPVPAAPRAVPTTPSPAPKTVVVPATPAVEKPAPARPEPTLPATPPTSLPEKTKPAATTPPVAEPLPAVKPQPVTPKPSPKVIAAPPTSLPETPKPAAPTPAAEAPAAVKPQPVTPRPSPKVVVPPPTPKLKPRSAEPEKPSTVTLPAPPLTTSPLDTVTPSAAPPTPVESPRHAPTPSGTVSTIAPSPVPAGTLGAIVFQGADPFTADELTPITGLSLGTTPTAEALQTASRQLIDTGYFFNVSASFDSVAGVGTATFVLQPAPATQLRRLSFANFVWLTPAEIDDVLKRVPLYHGYGSIPAANNGPLIASIQSALTRALTARGVNAMITHADVPPNALHPYTAIEFRVVEPRVVLDSASLFDIPPSLVAKTLKAQELAVKQPYNEGIAGTTLTDLLLRPARDAGYIGAKLWRIDRKRRPMGNNVGVVFTARMDAGPLYTVRSLGWVPTPIYSSTDFHRNAGLMAGKPPTPGGLEKTQQSILDAYHAQGYVDAVVLVNSDLDPKSGGASYTFSVDPGPQYLLRTIKIQGLPPDVQKDFEADWTIKPGDVYNEDYLLNFLNNHPNIKSLKGYTFDYNRSSMPDSHMIDLVITFKPTK